MSRPVRFAPDALDVARLALREPGIPFHPEMSALIYDESPPHGCGLVLLDDPLLQPDRACTVQVGRMDPVAARIVWKKPLEDRLVHVGVQYLE